MNNNETFKFQVNIGGIIELLSHHLYSSPKVFVRELLQNAVDAITARNFEEPQGGHKITVELITTGEVPVIEVTDTGTGLTLDEIHKFLSIIGESSKRDNLNSADFIGRFGIGLLSGFLVSDEIMLETKSSKSDKAYCWHGMSNGLYKIEEADRVQTGSKVILTATQNALEFFDFDMLHYLITFYGDILPYPVFLKHGDNTVHVNSQTPPWLTPALSSPLDIMNYGEDYLQDRFMFYIPIKTETGGVEGVAYVLDRRINPGIKSSHRVYLKNMLLAEDCKELFPGWAFFIRAIVNVQSLKPTASREDFYKDNALENAKNELGEIIKDRLKDMARDNSEFMGRFLNEHHLALKALAIEDEEIMDTFLDYIPFETSFGYMVFKSIRELTDNIEYVTNIDDFKQISALYEASHRLLLNAGYVYEEELISAAAQRYPEINFIKVTPEDALNIMADLTANEYDNFRNIESFATDIMIKWDCSVVVKKFIPADIPAMLLANEEAFFIKDLRYAKENANDLFASLLDKFDDAKKPTTMFLCLNANNILIKKMAEKDNYSEAVFDLIYVQCMLLARKPLKKGEMSALNNGIIELIANSL